MARTPYDMKPLTMIHEVFPEDTNTYGTMFGGDLMALMDKTAGICASKFAHENFVTASIDRVKFLEPIKQGDIVESTARTVYTSTHTLGLEVTAVARDRKSWLPRHCCTACFFMVAVDGHGGILPIPSLVPGNEEEKEKFEEFRRIHEKLRNRSL